MYPFWDWSEENVIGYLHAHDVPLPVSYRYASHSFDCMDCTAWWGDGLSRFLEAEYPSQHVEYVRRIGLIKSAIAEEISNCEV